MSLYDYDNIKLAILLLVAIISELTIGKGRYQYRMSRSKMINNKKT